MSMNLNAKSMFSTSVATQDAVAPTGPNLLRRGISDVSRMHHSALSEGATQEMSALLQQSTSKLQGQLAAQIGVDSQVGKNQRKAAQKGTEHTMDLATFQEKLDSLVTYPNHNCKTELVDALKKCTTNLNTNGIITDFQSLFNHLSTAKENADVLKKMSKEERISQLAKKLQEVSKNFKVEPNEKDEFKTKFLEMMKPLDTLLKGLSSSLVTMTDKLSGDDPFKSVVVELLQNCSSFIQLQVGEDILPLFEPKPFELLVDGFLKEVSTSGGAGFIQINEGKDEIINAASIAICSFLLIMFVGFTFVICMQHFKEEQQQKEKEEMFTKNKKRQNGPGDKEDKA